MLSLLKQRNILILTVCQVLFWVTLMAGIAVTSLVGQILASDNFYATFPAGFLALSGIFVTRIASSLMQKFGRKLGFLIGATSGVAGCALCMLAILQSSFIMFCIGSAILGAHQAIGLYYRLAATDAVPMENKGQAVSVVMAGGVAAAVIAPTLSLWSQKLLMPYLYAGTFAVLALLCVAIFLLLALLEDQQVTEENSAGQGRSLGELFRQPVLIMAVTNAAVAQGLMVLLMLSMPLAMVACGFGKDVPVTVMQWHFLAMFGPSFFTGNLIQKFGAANVALAGALLLLSSIVFAATGITFYNFSVALILLGLGWNFMHVAGTTMVTYTHLPEERGKVQGTSEMIILCVSACAAFSSGGLQSEYGWTVVNIAAVPVIIVAALITWRFSRTQEYKTI
ncbi:MAG: MFS transporter [Methyloligellaceae bacterium]